jgi:adenylate kinase family enzyme
MAKTIIFGNSGSGKSTLAKQLARQDNALHLDLDTLAWLPTTPPQRMPIAQSEQLIRQTLANKQNWLVEGCYADLLTILCDQATHAIFLNLPIEMCIENARARPWEPHKYASKALQDKNLEMLIGWISQYITRRDSFSLEAHKQLYTNFSGDKVMYVTRPLQQNE